MLRHWYAKQGSRSTPVWGTGRAFPFRPTRRRSLSWRRSGRNPSRIHQFRAAYGRVDAACAGQWWESRVVGFRGRAVNRADHSVENVAKVTLKPLRTAGHPTRSGGSRILTTDVRRDALESNRVRFRSAYRMAFVGNGGRVRVLAECSLRSTARDSSQQNITSLRDEHRQNHHPYWIRVLNPWRVGTVHGPRTQSFSTVEEAAMVESGVRMS